MTAGMTVATIRAMIIRLVQDILWNFFCMGILLISFVFCSVLGGFDEYYRHLWREGQDN